MLPRSVGWTRALDHATDLVLGSESRHRLICVSGASQSGKSTFAESLRGRLLRQAHATSVVCMDDFYWPADTLTADDLARGFDRPDSMDLDCLSACLRSWRGGRRFAAPRLEFYTDAGGGSTSRRRWVDQAWFGTVILEGLFAHYSPFSCDALVSVYLMPGDEGTRRQRRLRRDTEERGYSTKECLRIWSTFVEPGFKKYVDPARADVLTRVDLCVTPAGERGQA